MRDDLVLYVSDQAHSSIARAARMLGFRPEQVRVLPSDERFQLAPETLRAAITADLARGLTPFCAVAQGGATNTGSVDPLEGLAEVCREHGAWLHVDAAYGGFAALADPGLLPALAQADSVTLDPHKWLYQPFECGCVLVRDGQALHNAFEILPDYLRDAEADAEEVNFCDLGLQLTRSARALKIWVSLRYFGLEAFREAIRRSLEVAAAAARRVEESQILELMAPPSLGVGKPLGGLELASVLCLAFLDLAHGLRARLGDERQLPLVQRPGMGVGPVHDPIEPRAAVERPGIPVHGLPLVCGLGDLAVHPEAVAVL